MASKATLAITGMHPASSVVASRRRDYAVMIAKNRMPRRSPQTKPGISVPHSS